MLRKIFLDDKNVVMCLAQVGSRESDVTFKQSTSHQFVEDDEVEVDRGYTFVDGMFVAPPKPDADTITSTGKVVPFSVKMKQARRALLAAELLDDVEEAIAGMDKATQIDWEFSENVERKSSLTLKLNAILQLTDDELDDLFITASKIGA